MNEGLSKKILRDSMNSTPPKESTWRKDKKGFQAASSWLENKKVKELIHENCQTLVRDKIISKPIANKSWQYIMCSKILNND